MQLSKCKSDNLKKYNSSWVRTEAIRYEPQRSDFHRIKQPWIKLCVSQPGTWVTVHDFTLHYHGSQRMAVIGSEKGVMGHWGHTELGLDTCEGSIAGLDGQRDIWRSTEWKLEREKEDGKYSNIEKKWMGSLAAFRELVSWSKVTDRDEVWDLTWPTGQWGCVKADCWKNGFDPVGTLWSGEAMSEEGETVWWADWWDGGEIWQQDRRKEVLGKVGLSKEHDTACN